MSKFGKVNRTLTYHDGPRPKSWPDREDLSPSGGGNTAAAAPEGSDGPVDGDENGPDDRSDGESPTAA